jgi:PAS domain S-box-containing protein
VNKSFDRLTGLKDVIGKKVTEAIPGIKEHNPEIFEIYGRVASSGVPEAFEVYVGALDRWFSVSAYSTEREHFVAVFDNVTERKRTEAALRKSEAQLSTAVRLAHLGPWEYDVDKDLFTFNDPFYEMLRTTVEQVGGYTMSSADYAKRFVHPDDMPVVGKEIRKSIEATDPNFTQKLEHRVIYGDGEVGHISVTISIVKDELGRTVRTYGVNQDITERKRVEETIRQSEERYRTFFDQSKDGVYISTRSGKLVEANQAYLDLFGFTKEELETQDVLKIYPEAAEENRERFRRDIEKTGSVKDYEITLKTKDGRLIDCLSTSTVIRAPDGAIVGYQGIVRDVTQYRQLQNELVQAQKMEAVGTLAGGVAHDFNNLLQVILGYSELLVSDERLTENYKADIERILHASKEGADLVQRLLTFSRKTEVKPRPLNLNRRIEQLKKMLSRTIPKMIAIELVLAEDLAAINADPTQIDQILMNLAVNARDAMPEGGRLTINTENVDLDREYAKTHPGVAPGRYVLLAVSDTGTGMDKETVEHIFEPFFTTKRPGDGTGLGLALVYGIVKQHGGSIACYSERGRGTTFKMYFPALVSNEKFEVPQTRPLPRGGSETILLVDDEELLRDLGSRILTKAGYQVITACHGREALEVYRERGDEISLVILDLIMPEMGGVQCLEGLLALDPSVRVVIASGYSADGTTNDTLASKTKGFIDKPYEISQVLEVVRDTLDQE